MNHYLSVLFKWKTPTDFGWNSVPGEVIQSKEWNQEENLCSYNFHSADYHWSFYACSFCSMLATKPLVSTRARIGLVKYNLLSKVLSPKTGLGIRLRKRRKAPSPTMAITTSTTATEMPADPWEASLTTWAEEAKQRRIKRCYYLSLKHHIQYIHWIKLLTDRWWLFCRCNNWKKKINTQCKWLMGQF